MKTIYELRRIRNSKDKDLIKALNIYVNNIEPALRTDSREIIYWLDNYHQQFEDEFILLGFYLNEVIVGFAEVAYFKVEKLLFVDYLVIEEMFRQNNTFYEFVSQIHAYLIENKYDINYAICEVGNIKEDTEPSTYTRSLVRLLKMTGFGVIKTLYYHPRLGMNNFESEIKSILMIWSFGGIKKIKTSTYLNVIDTIYYKHYQRWYKHFLNENENIVYNNSLNVLFEKAKQQVHNKNEIEINGYPISTFKGMNERSLSKYKSITKVMAIMFLFIFFVFLFGLIHIIIKQKLGLDITTQNSIIIGSGVGVLFILSLFAEGKKKSLSEIIDKLIDRYL